MFRLVKGFFSKHLLPPPLPLCFFLLIPRQCKERHCALSCLVKVSHNLWRLQFPFVYTNKHAIFLSPNKTVVEDHLLFNKVRKMPIDVKTKILLQRLLPKIKAELYFRTSADFNDFEKPPNRAAVDLNDSRRIFFARSSSDETKRDITCHNCRKRGHIARE